MFRRDSTAEAAFRQEARSWIEANLPMSLRGSSVRPPPTQVMPWYRKLSERGWIAPHWPKQYGGMGATLAEQIVLSEELARVAAPALPVQGINHIGPILMKFGTDAQKAQHLPPIIRGDVIWAQGYSEPGSGSDLASLSTLASLEGDKFIVNGHKIWQTWGHHADWMFCLVRTDPNAERKQAGISFLLVKLDTPGIRIRPIVTIANDDELSESFFDNVVVPAENLIGTLHGGWAIANDLLAHERLGIANPQAAMEALARIEAIARANGLIDNAAFQDRLAGVRIKVVTQAALFNHAVSLTGSGRHLGPDAAILKLVATDVLHTITDMLVEVAGCHGADLNRLPVAGGVVDATQLFLLSRRASIYGGSSEILRNIVSKRVLNLPG